MLTMMQNLGWLSAFACLMLGAHLLRPRANQAMPSVLLGIAFLVMGLQSVLISLVLEHGRGAWAIFLPSSALSLGPLFFMYFESIVDTNYSFTKARSLHFLPAFICLAEMATGLFWLDPDLMIVLSFGAYTFALLSRAIRGRAQFKHLGAHQNVIYLWLVSCVVIFAMSLLNEVLILVELQQGKPINRSVALLVGFLAKLTMLSFALLSALEKPSPFDWLIGFSLKNNRPAPQSAEDVSYRALVDKFVKLVVDEKLYAQEGVSLKNVAKLLDAPQRQLSQAINHVYGESFSKRMNRLRVEEAKRLLANPSGNSIVKVMLDSGFRTKSNFNKEFLAIEGLSPRDFRDANK